MPYIPLGLTTFISFFLFHSHECARDSASYILDRRTKHCYELVPKGFSSRCHPVLGLYFLQHTVVEELVIKASRC